MIIQSLFGLLALTGLAWAVSENRRLVRPKLVALGLAVQLALVQKAGPCIHVALFHGQQLIKQLLIHLPFSTDAA